jgi:hypothetical protein
MKGIRMLAGLLAIGATVASSSACFRTNQAGGDVAPASVIGLKVMNDNFLDVDVYAVSQGLATRVGTATGNSTRSFVLDATMRAQDLRIVATPIGGNGRASTGPVQAGPGQTIEFRVGSQLTNSSVFIR